LDELRWILLVLGILAIGAIWLWSARGSRQAPGNAELREPTVTHPHGPSVATPGVATPGVATPGAPTPEPAPLETRASAADRREWGVPPLEPLSIRTADFAEVPALDQPMLTHADPVDFGLDSSRATGQARFARSPTAVRSAPMPPGVATPGVATRAPVIELEPVPLDDEPVDDVRFDDVRTDASAEIEIGGQTGEELRTEAEVAAEEEARAEYARAREHSDRHAVVTPQPANRSEKQKIVTVRVCAVGEARWAGGDLMNALEVLGLAYGRYQVYHRKHNDGRSIFCVASLVEPGIFDLSTMPDEQFRGVSLFAVLPGPLEPMQTVEALLATARELARALSGTMQDAKGIPFSPQRTEALLQDVARFQALLA
jgi:FtsZ-interacting cell division protein ZipA